MRNMAGMTRQCTAHMTALAIPSLSAPAVYLEEWNNECKRNTVANIGKDHKCNNVAFIIYLCVVSGTEYIRGKGLKVTPVRLKVLEELQDTHQAMSHTELEATFGKVDRITLYRALKDFEEAGIVHKIVGADGITRFAVCSHDCPDVTHTDDHVHFNCSRCHKMFCRSIRMRPASNYLQALALPV